MNHDRKDDIYLEAFLSCWLYAFVFSNREGNSIRFGTFKTASITESGWMVGLVISLLASIYNVLNKIFSST